MSEAIQLVNLLIALCPSFSVYRRQLEAKVRKLVGRARS